MIVVDKPSEYLKKILPKQKKRDGVVYRPLKYTRKYDFGEETILFNMLSGEVLLLDNSEVGCFLHPDNIDSSVENKLIEKWFLVPEYTDDCKLSKQLTAVIQNLNSLYTNPKLKSFIILPTTDCNARCFYCYELGRSRKNMSEKTAADVVDYIMRKKAEGKIKIHWFGGEPLYNVEIIDYISSELEKRGVSFKSHMVSNGYLFDDDMILRAKDSWKLQKVQITIDGTREIYNRVKAYIYKDCVDPFERVVSNIEKLLNAGIQVHIRLNMDMHNIDDLFELCDFLKKRFSGYDNYYIYPHLLYNTEKMSHQAHEQLILKKKYRELQNILEGSDVRKEQHIEITHFENRCMADTDTSVMILPDGELGKCEHHTEDMFIGSIYDEKLDYDLIRSLKKLSPPLEKCDKCDLRPACVRLECCPNHKNETCFDIDKELKEERLEALIKRNYSYWKKTNECKEG